ncbi:hypothetical protein [Actinomycetospora flava]|uniref:Uncharacterized protein n=1 Tax=Actinomycetospora flava TaxID=3129232 RepID=A0ABU8MGZ3_9PSEU
MTTELPPGWKVKPGRGRTDANGNQRDYVVVTAPDGARFTWYESDGAGDVRLHRPDHLIELGSTRNHPDGDSLYVRFLPMRDR